MTKDSSPKRARTGRFASFAKYLGLSILFCAILWGILFALGQVLQPKDNSKEAGQLQARAYGFLAEPDNTVDVLFIGDSLASTAISPMSIWETSGVTSFVCSANGEQVSYAITLLSDFFKTQSPQVVFLEAEMLYSPVDVGKMFKQFVKDQLAVIEYHHRWKELTPADFSERTSYDEVSDLKGFNPKAFHEPADTSSYMLPDDSVVMPGDLNIMILQILAKMCEDNGAELVLIATPQTRCWNYGRHNGSEKLASETGIGFVDMNVEPLASQVGIDWSVDSRDAGIHLNWRGTEKVSAWMSVYLSEQLCLEDHRGDPAYSQWGECLTRYRRHMQDVEARPEAHDVAGSHMY